MTKHPYADLDSYHFWSKSISKITADNVDPVVSAPFTLSQSDKIVTAGSCFAQHLAKRLEESGYNYYVTENLPEILSDLPKNEFGYRTYSARYGNIYTARQLLQLFDRAYGLFIPEQEFWNTKGYFVDPWRPAVEANGYKTLSELRFDRQYHLSSVRKAFEEADLFIFTLGLTEAWIDTRDGAVYPVAPGVIDGAFNPELHKFHNFSVTEVLSDMKTFLDKLWAINKNVKVLLTVSPVPLAATYENKQVMVATTYSKSVLRVVAEELSNQFENVTYFPSYEIITGSFNDGRYFAKNKRDVVEEGVDHVMRVFRKHFLSDAASTPIEKDKPLANKSFSERVTQLECEESLLDLDP